MKVLIVLCMVVFAAVFKEGNYNYNYASQYNLVVACLTFNRNISKYIQLKSLF